MIAQLLQDFPCRPGKLVQFHHHVLQRSEKPIHVGLTDIQRRKYFYYRHRVTGYLGEDVMIIEERQNDCLGEQVLIHLVYHAPGCSERHRVRLAEFDRNHEASLTNTFEKFKAGYHCFYTASKAGTQFQRTLLKLFLIKDLE